MQEILGPEVIVPVFNAGVDAAGVNLHVNGGRLRVVLVKFDGAAKVGEFTAHLTDHHVAHGKFNV